MSPVMTGQAVSVAANSTSGNVLSGRQYEFPSVPSLVEVLAVAAAVGLNMTFVVGGITLVNDEPVNQSNRWPIYPDDVVESIGVSAGERLFLEFRNTTGAAITVNYKVNVNPL